MKLRNHPISTMLGGALEGIGVGLTFTMGVVGGAAAVFIVLPWGLDRWYWYPLATLVLVPYSVFKLWGVLLLPLYLTMLHGLICHEWNRLLCFSILAMVTSIIILISMAASVNSRSTISPWQKSRWGCCGVTGMALRYWP